MNELIDQFARLTSVSAEMRKCLEERIIQLDVEKGEHLHKAGEVCHRTFWVMKGLLRTYYIKDGKEVTDAFAAEGETLTAKSFMTNQPDQYYLQAIENSSLCALTNADLMFMFEHFPEMERYGRITMSIFYLKLADRLESYQFTLAKEKYDHFLETHRSVIGRLPLGMVASYLGISQETLSRIRAKP